MKRVPLDIWPFGFRRYRQIFSILPRQSNVFLVLLTLCSMALLIWQAKNPVWQMHLRADTVIYHHRITTFLPNHSWSTLKENEYQPGALWWMLVPAYFASDNTSYNSYLTAFWAINLLLLGTHIFLAERFGSPAAPWVMLAVATAIGPILLYRFELIVSLMVLIAWLLWREKRWGLASFLLGVATATKMYPLILLPLLTAQAWRTDGIRGALRSLTGFLLGLVAPVISLLLAGSTLGAIDSALNFHRDKPIGLDGALGSLIPILQRLMGISLRMAPRNSIHGFDTDISLLKPLIDWLWLPLYLGTLSLLLRKVPKEKYADAGALFTLMLAFLIFQKNNNPQYAWWAASLLPMISSTWLSKKTNTFLVLLVSVSLLLAQLVYPIHYQDLLDAFYGGHPTASLAFLVNLVKNLLGIAALLISFLPLLQSQPPANQKES